MDFITRYFAKRALIAALFVIFFCSFAGDASARGTFASLDDPMLDRLLEAAESSPNIAAARERAAQSRALLSEEASKMRPGISLFAGGLWGKESLASAAIDPRSGMPIASVPLAAKNTYFAMINLYQVLSSGGALEANERAAKLAHDVSRAEAVRVYQSVMDGVRRSYFSARRAAAALAVAGSALDLALAHLSQAEAMHASGLVPAGDVMRVKVSVSQAELDRIRAKNSLDIALAALERASGVTVEADNFVASGPRASNGVAGIEPPHYAPPSDATASALDRRAEIKTCELQRARAMELVGAAAATRRPRVYVEGSGLLIGDDFPPKTGEWYVGLGADWTIFDGGASKAREDRARSAARELIAVTDDLRGMIKQEAVGAELSLRSAQQRLTVALDQMRTAEEDHRIALSRYESRIGTNIDVLDSRVSLIASRTAYVDAVYDIALAQSGLIFAIGEDMPPDDMF